MVRRLTRVQDPRYDSAEASQTSRNGRPPELDLLFLCARWPQTPEDQQLIRFFCEQGSGEQAGRDRPLNWQRFLLLAQHHRLIPLLWHNLHAAMPEPRTPEQSTAFAELRELSAANTYRSLRSLTELRRVIQQLHTSGVASVRVLKGLPLAQSLFGDIGLRITGDLDLLIDQSSILDADRVLRDFGYRGLFQVDRFSPKRLAFYRTHWKDLAYRNPATGYEVDLHWRCFRNSRMPGGGLCATPAASSVCFGAFCVDTLPPMETVLYLCVHGTLDGWLYLKSLVDVAAQTRTLSQAQLDALAELAITYGILPELSAALLLVRRYLAIDAWSARLLPETDPTVRHILRYTDRALAHGHFLAGREAIPIATTLAFELGLRRNLRYRFELLLRVLFRARMWETIPLPDPLFALYPLLSPFEWIVFRLRQRRQKAEPSPVPSTQP
jgi:Uncharacterised nucleotidyltransferase